MESYQKRKKRLEETYGKLVQVNTYNDEVLEKTHMMNMLNKLLILQTRKG